MHNTDLHEDVNIQMDLLQEGGGTLHMFQSPQNIGADLNDKNVGSLFTADKEEDEQLRYDHALLFAPVRRFADLLQPSEEENTYTSLSSHNEIPQYIQEIDKHIHRRHHYPHVHHPLHQMEPRALRKVRRRMRRVREEDRLRNPPSVIPLELQIASGSDETSDNNNVVRGSGRRRRRSSKKQEPFRPVLSHLEEDGGEEVSDLQHSSVECVEERVHIVVTPPPQISFLEEIHSEMPPISLQPLTALVESAVTRGVLEDVNSPSIDHRHTTQQMSTHFLSPSSRVSFQVGGGIEEEQHYHLHNEFDFKDWQDDSVSLQFTESTYLSPSRSHHAQKEYFSAELLRKRTCSGADIADDTMELRKSVTEPDEAATLQQADLDEMRSHRFADFRGLRHPHMRKTSKQCDRARGREHMDELISESTHTGTAQYDHTPHELFVEMDELLQFTSNSDCSSPCECIWVERSRWIRFEENLEPTSARWTQPHVAPLQFHALAEFRRLLEQGCCLFDLDAKDLFQIVECICQELLRSDTLNISEVTRLRQDLLCRHVHKALPQSDMAHVTTAAKPSLLHKFQHAATSFLQQQQHTIASRVPSDAQTVSVLVGGVSYLQRPLLVFVRLAQAVHLLDMPLTEVPTLPLRFLLICMGPISAAEDCHEVGRSFATLMTDVQFHRHAFSADCREDLTSGLREFLERTTVLPPFHEGSASAWHSAQMIRHLARFQRRRRTWRQRTSAQRGCKSQQLGLTTLSGEPSDFTDSLLEVSRSSTPCVRISTSTVAAAGVCGGIWRFQYFRELLRDVRIQGSRLPNDWWRWTRVDNALPTVLFGVILVFIGSLMPCLTLGALMQDLVSADTFTIERSLMATVVGQALYSTFGGQPLLIVGVTGPILIMELATKSLLLHVGIDVSLSSFRFIVAIYTSIVSLSIIGLNGAQLIQRITRSTEEILNMFVGFFFLVQAFAKIFGPLLHVSLASHCHSSTSSNATLFSSIDNASSALVVSEDAFCLKMKSLRLRRDKTALEATVVVCGSPDECSLSHVRAKAAAMILLSLLMLFLIVSLNKVRQSNLFTRKIRAVFVAGHVLVASVLVTALNDLLLKDFCLETLTVSQRVKLPDIVLLNHLINPFGKMHGLILHLLALAMAVGIALIIFIETGLCCVTLVTSEKRLFSRSSGYHSSLLVTGVLLPPLCAYFGWPFLTGSVVRSTTHTYAMGLWDARQPPGVPPQLLGVAEQRVSGLCVALLLLCSFFATPLLSFVPMAVIYGVFAFMGFMALRNLQVTGRCMTLLQGQRQSVGGTDYLQIPTSAILAFTCIQLVFVGLLVSLNLGAQIIGKPYLLLAFPALIVTSLLCRTYFYPRLPCIAKYLDVLDRCAPTASLDMDVVHQHRFCRAGGGVGQATKHLLHAQATKFEHDSTDQLDNSNNSSFNQKDDLFDDTNKPV